MTMSTTTATATITIDRHERDVLRGLLELRLDGDGIRLDSEYMHERRQEFEEGFAILDHIGWEKEDPRDTFELPVDELVRRFLKRERESLSGYVADEALRCEQVRERADAIMGPGEHSSEEWAHRETEAQRSLEGALEELQVIEWVSRRARKTERLLERERKEEDS